MDFFFIIFYFYYFRYIKIYIFLKYKFLYIIKYFLYSLKKNFLFFLFLFTVNFIFNFYNKNKKKIEKKKCDSLVIWKDNNKNNSLIELEITKKFNDYENNNYYHSILNFIKKNFNKIKNFFLKIKDFDFYTFLNILFYFFFIFNLKLKKNLFFLLKNTFVKINSEKLNLFSFILFFLWFIFTIFIFLYNNNYFYNIVNNLNDLHLNYKIILIKILIFMFYLIVLLTGCSFMDLNMLTLTLIGSALGVGISISIQKIIINYVCSFIILIDKSFKIGDAVSLNGFQGVITKINSRYVVLRNLDCSEILIPNEKFISDVIQNQSLYFSKGNLRVSIQVSYNNNMDLVLNILVLSTKNIDRILENPIPVSYINSFNIDGIDLELSFWIVDAVRGASLVKSEVSLKLLRLLKLNNIELSFSKKLIKII